METNNQYIRPKIEVVDFYSDEMMKDFVPYSETEVIDGPIVDTDPDDGLNPGVALGKGNSVWDE
ncbi:MAG: hypothetical protein IJK42_01365 [Prevotella sp.]|nr:hypothetical protein [Prevotella sp.]MBQ6208410.1 hypothetical protein [Prevotella sp.]